MTKKLTTEEVKEKLLEIHGDEIALDESTYSSTREKAKFIDKEYGEWWATPNNILRGRKHNSRKQNRIKKTTLERHGVENAFNIKNVRQKCVKSRSIGVDEVERRLFVLYGDLVKIKRDTYRTTQKDAVFVDRDFGEWTAKVYNVLYNNRSHPDRGKIKQRETNMRLYGVENPTQCEEIKKKIIETNMKKIGVPYNFQTKEFREQSKKACEDRFGVDNPMKHPDIARKSAKKTGSSTISYHWKTREELICRSSWEEKVIARFNQEQKNFLWESKTFAMPDGRTYTPDCYLPDEDLWIEIKGRFIGDAEEKWLWFKSEYPNSELWTLETLKEKNIL